MEIGPPTTEEEPGFSHVVASIFRPIGDPPSEPLSLFVVLVL